MAFTTKVTLKDTHSEMLLHKTCQVTSLQLHGFSDASENAYSGVVYLQMEDTDTNVHVALVASKTRVFPIKRLLIPRLELCRAHILTKLRSHVRSTLSIPIQNVMVWTDSTIVINWLDSSPCRFKTYVPNILHYQSHPSQGLESCLR